jgi:hypothetical protein
MKKILLPILLYGQVLSAQTGLWTDAGISKKWNKALRSSLELGYRQNLGLGFDRIYVDFSQSVKVYDGIRLEGAYRLIVNENANQLPIGFDQLSQRIQIGLNLSILDLFDFAPKRLDFSFASSQQWGFEVAKRNNSIWRNKLSLSYDIKNFPLSPCFSAEHFYRWNANVVYTPTEVLISGATVQWRYFVGAAVELPKQHSLKLQVGLRSRASGIQPLVRASYQYSLN